MKLTKRQQATRDLILFFEKNDNKTYKFDIFVNYQKANHPDGYQWSENPNTHDQCAAIWLDIKKINESDDFEKIILTSKNGDYFYIAKTKEEVENYIKEKYIDKAKSKLKRASDMIKKIKQNGQGKFSDTIMIDFVETFGKEE